MKKSYCPESYESMGKNFVDGKTVRRDTSANIFESMLLHPAFQDLSERERLLYVIVKAQRYGKRKPGRDFKDVPELQDENHFYLGWHDVQKYGIYTDASQSNFYRNMNSLQEHGFIKKHSSGKPHHRRNIWEFSDKWQSWKKENP